MKILFLIPSTLRIAIWLFLILFIPFQFLKSQSVGYYKTTYSKNTVTVSKTSAGDWIGTDAEIYLKTLRANAGVDIYVNKLQLITSLKVYKAKVNGKKYRKIKPVVDMTGAEGFSDFTGTKRIIIYLPDTGSYKIVYSYTSDNLILAGNRLMYDQAYDSLSFLYKIPSQYALLYRIEGDSSRIRYAKDKKGVNFLIYPNDNLRDYLTVDYNPMLQTPVQAFVKIIVVPEEYKNKPEKYYQRWYFDLLGENNVMGKESKKTVDSVCGDLTDTLAIIDRLYKFVTRRINYVGLFDSWDAYIPKSVDKVLQSRYGDCKNMANLLTAMLNYKNIEAYYGITSSIHHPTDMDFPAIISGDHAICVVRAGGRWFFLDPTIKSSFDLSPSSAIQGRTVLAMNTARTFYLRIPYMPVSYNLKKVDHDLYFDGRTFKGTFKAIFTGHYLEEIKDLYMAAGQVAFGKLLNKIIWENAGNYASGSIDYRMADTVCSVTGKATVSANSVHTLDHQRMAIFPDFISCPDVFEMSNHKYNVLTGMQCRDELTYDLHFNRPVKLIRRAPVLFTEDGLLFSFAIMQDDPTCIRIEVVYEIPYNLIRVDDLAKMERCSRLINTTLNNAIEIE